jgi:hypothetical protein
MISTFQSADQGVNTSIQLADLEAMSWLTFATCGLRINMRTGEVVIPEGLSLDEASRAFWEGLSRVYPLNSGRASAG